MVAMPFFMDSLLVKKVRKRTPSQRSKGQGIGSALVAITTFLGGKRAMPAIKRSLSVKLSRIVGQKSLSASKKTELAEEEQKVDNRKI